MAARPETAEGKPARRALRAFLWLGAFALLLFVPAGTVRWPGAWAFLAIMAVASFWGFAWLGRHDPELLKERMRPPFQREQLPQDKLLMGTFLPLWLGWYVLMGLDRRFGWSSVPALLQILGAVLLCLGIWLSWQVEGEQLRRAGGQGAEGTRAQGGDHRPLCLCAAPHVCRSPLAVCRDSARARLVVVGRARDPILASIVVASPR